MKTARPPAVSRPADPGRAGEPSRMGVLLSSPPGDVRSGPVSGMCQECALSSRPALSTVRPSAWLARITCEERVNETMWREAVESVVMGK